MHVTVRKLGQFPSDDPGVVGRLAELRHIAASHPKFDLTMCGLNLSPTTVYGNQIVRALHAPPGPKGHLLRDNLREYAKDPLGFLSRCAREYGDIVQLRSVGQTFYLLRTRT